MNNRKKWVSILAGVMAAVMLLSLILSMIPTKASALSSKEIKNQINALKQKNNQLEQQIEDVQNQFEENEDEIANMVHQKYAIDQEIGLLYDQIDNINQQLAAYGLLIADQQDDLDDAQARFDELSAKNKERIRAMEEDGGISYWSVLFKANSFADLLDRLNMIEEIAAADRRRLKELSKAAEEVAGAKEELVAEKDELQVTMEELDAAKAQLAQKQEEAQAILNALIEKGYELENLYDQYELEIQQTLDEIAMKEAEYELQKELEWIAYMATYTTPPTEPPATQAPSTESTKETTGSGDKNDATESAKPTESNKETEETKAPESSKETEATEPPKETEPTSSGEKWMVPCTYRQLSSPFGERESPTAGASSNHQGIDLAGPEGTPIYATKSGMVVVSTYGKAAGNYVTIRHDDTYSSIYMHLSRSVVKKNQVVKQGELIGYMGSTGIVTGSHLHFGIIKSGTYVNPANYMYFHP